MKRIKFDDVRTQQDTTGMWLMLRIPPAFRLPARVLCGEINPGELYVAEIKKFREKRSLDANAYFWTLCGKLAAVTGIPKNEIYREYIREIGDNFDIVLVKAGDVESRKKRWEARGMGWISELVGPSAVPGYLEIAEYYGSSSYDSAQMTRLIDLVVFDCKEQGIETATPDELARMKREWNQ